jgi:hypothetical protein
MHATQVLRPFHTKGWVYEEKIDGWRILALKDAGRANGLGEGTARQPDRPGPHPLLLICGRGVEFSPVVGCAGGQLIAFTFNPDPRPAAQQTAPSPRRPRLRPRGHSAPGG